MEYRRIGNAGIRVSAISLGAWLTYGSDRVAFETAEKCLHTAIENGINYVDVADAYALGKAEETVGKVMKSYERSNLVISTKAYWPMSDDPNDQGLSRKHIIESVHKSLKRFDTDYVDLFFCHRYDDNTPTEETVRAIEDLIRQGKILYWGTSMWPAHGIEEAVMIANAVNANRPITEQPRYNMLQRDQVEGPVEEVAAKHDIGLVVWSPLAGGLLTGKYNNGIPEGSRAEWMGSLKDQLTEENLNKISKLGKLAADMGTTLPALALAWALRNQVVDSVITGASKPEQVISNLAALEVEITDEINEQIESILDNKVFHSKSN